MFPQGSVCPGATFRAVPPDISPQRSHKEHLLILGLGFSLLGRGFLAHSPPDVVGAATAPPPQRTFWSWRSREGCQQSGWIPGGPRGLPEGDYCLFSLGLCVL